MDDRVSNLSPWIAVDSLLAAHFISKYKKTLGGAVRRQPNFYWKSKKFFYW